MSRFAIAALLLPLVASAATAEPFRADVWADNWFEMRIDGTKVVEDSVPITTERSFNAETFEFDADRPFVIGVVAKDFKSDDTGLEYIRTRRQHMGDGGLIVQIEDRAGEKSIVSSADWQCLTVHTAPLDKSCAAEADPIPGEGACGFAVADVPAGWDRPGFDASDWPRARVYTAAEVDPKGGYDGIAWDPKAQLIWGGDLEQSNTVLCRIAIQ